MPEKPAKPEELRIRLRNHLALLKKAQKSNNKVKQYEETLAAAGCTSISKSMLSFKHCGTRQNL